MTLEITTEAQAEAAREILSLYDRIHELRNTLGNDDTQKSKLKAALAAYEQRKAMQVELTELEMAVLVQSTHDGHEIHTAIKSLRRKGLAKDETCVGYGCNASDLGRAYLAAQKPKMRWEVRGTDGVLLCYCEEGEKGKRNAYKIVENMNLQYYHYEVREVQ